MTNTTTKGILCGNCKDRHATIDQIKSCYQLGPTTTPAREAILASRPLTADQIGEVMAVITKPAPVAVPAGHYVATIDGVDRFYKIGYGKKGSKWEGFLFIDAQASDEYWPVKNKEHKAAIMNAIKDQGIMECLARYGHALGKCGICNRTLTDPDSIAAGIGPVCAAGL